MVVLTYIGFPSRDAKVVNLADHRREREMAALFEAMSSRRTRNLGMLGLNSLELLRVESKVAKEPA